MNYNWNWGIFGQLSPDGTYTYWQTIALGQAGRSRPPFRRGSSRSRSDRIVGVLRTSPLTWGVRLGNAYVELFRNIPLLVQMFLWYFVLPELLPNALGRLAEAAAQRILLYGGGLSRPLYVRARRRADPRRHPVDPARPAPGRHWRWASPCRRPIAYVLLPMAYRIILPPLTSEFLNIIKNSAVALTIGLLELTARARAMQEFSFQVFEAFTAATVIYILINIVVVTLMRRLEGRLNVPGYIGSAKVTPAH